MALKGINIKKSNHVFIDGFSGEQFTPQQFAARYSAVNVGGNRINLPTEEREGGEEEIEGQEDIQVNGNE